MFIKLPMFYKTSHYPIYTTKTTPCFIKKKKKNNYPMFYIYIYIYLYINYPKFLLKKYL